MRGKRETEAKGKVKKRRLSVEPGKSVAVIPDASSGSSVTSESTDESVSEDDDIPKLPVFPQAPLDSSPSRRRSCRVRRATPRFEE